jgi:ribosome-associated translation inhibitor RaiA
MSIEVHIRHEAEATTKKFAEVYAQQCAEQIVEKFNKVDNVHVVVDHQRFMYVAHIKGHTIEATEHAENLRSAIDTAAARVIKQLRKLTSKVEAVHTHQAKHV